MFFLTASHPIGLNGTRTPKQKALKQTTLREGN